MTPFFFGPQEQLFGLHLPAQGRAKEAGVVICGPAPQEYMLTAWALRKLAAACARAGYEVLRFDYFGVGDSAGATSEGTLARWERDVVSAAQELKALTGVRKVSLLGLRVGAVLAARASAALNVDLLGLWEPVVDGERYVDELFAVHTDLRRHVIQLPKSALSDETSELLGYEMPWAHRGETRAIRLSEVPMKAKQISVVSGAITPAYEGLVAAVRARGQKVTHHVVSAVQGAAGAQLLGNEALDKLVECLGEKRA